jgi:hypothetical protein
LLVDTQGLVIRACVHAADLTEASGLKLLLTPLKGLLPRLKLLWADSGYKEGIDVWAKTGAYLKIRNICQQPAK